ncbi:MAG: metallophosphoesterase [Vicinamibacterales bacterium]
MRGQRLPALIVLLGIVAVTMPALGARAAQEAAPARIVAIGDIHGAGDAFVRILQKAGLIDGSQRWSGGTATLVQTGDYLDRGGAVRPILDLLMRLETEAKAAGGRVEVLLGNHEVMNMLHELSDVSPEAYASFADTGSADRLKKAFDTQQAAAKRSGAAAPGDRTAWMAAHPAGFVEYLDAMGPRGRYGKWLRDRRAAIRIGTTAFMHAGLSPASTESLDEVTREVARDLASWDRATDTLTRERLASPNATLKETVAIAAADLERIAAAVKGNRPVDARVTSEYVDQLRAIIGIGESPLLAGEGPMWFRGLSRNPPEDTDAEVTALLARLNVARLVVAHTPQLPGRIGARFDNRVFAIDTGMLSTYFKGGKASALELAGGTITAIYEDANEVLVGK